MFELLDYFRKKVEFYDSAILTLSLINLAIVVYCVVLTLMIMGGK